ncbi:membrane protein insertion efficiency factor YidD [Helicobacter marmotae]|uniref:Membrane protein insertion efficiency factor YidD n=1 Tax=Helicobacter marmotae TaxID=152490 RepID=A0A3D8I1E6_9HELI|nr:membrane protein insertion efficiency factor YidD [Helicobacter marmotae]RDU58915.1 membrane protein insertion efficiency factor YidD [Helicobacter marmotae]
MQQIISYVCIGAIKCYQKYLSPLTRGACRYYPSCSQYALWLFYFDKPLFAFIKSCLRLLRCNQLFAGGIAYPKVRLCLRHITFTPKKVEYWLIPTTNRSFLDIMPPFDKAYNLQVYIIKSFF